MQELKTGDKVNITNGVQAKIIKELGRGGQGIVYLVDLGGKQMALKWYLKAPDNKFYKKYAAGATYIQDLTYSRCPNSAQLKQKSGQAGI